MDCYKTAQRILYGNDFYLLLAGEKFEDRYADEIRRWCAKCHTELRFAYAESECYIIGCEKCQTKTLVQARNTADALDKVGTQNITSKDGKQC